MLLESIATLENPTHDQINEVLNQYTEERDPSEKPSPFTKDIRETIDRCFRHNTVEAIFEDLERHKKLEGEVNQPVSEWAAKTLETLHLRSPTSLKVTLRSIIKGRQQPLFNALETELDMATAFVVSCRVYFMSR
jgi:3-hydroxyisobutyryl-CoA hydrolase